MGILDGKVVLITGAGRGQGRSHALRVAEEGGQAVLVDLGDGQVRAPDYPTATRDDLDQTQALLAEQGAEGVAFEADVRDLNRMEQVCADTVEHFGHLDGVVANAGIGDAFRPAWEIELTHWRTMLDVNLTGVFITCKAAIPHLLRSPGGSLVLVSSVAGIKPIPYFAHYTVAKAGVRSLALTLAVELGPLGVRCNSLHPGAIDSPMTDAISGMTDIKRDDFLQQFRDNQAIPEVMTPRDTSAAVVWLLSDQAAHVTGLEMTVDAGETKK